ncbi:hypothetical protein PspLS_11377 [Pyricularia sp. CBS 133598]|nr:hypothetical protein PspLS_11377 [Pyricularia sp. CBS 133598]
MENVNLINAFKAVCSIFTVAAVLTGTQAIVNPTAFAISFGIPLNQPLKSAKQTAASTTNTTKPPHHDSTASSYIALVGARQLGTGITLLVFAYQGKWVECATILSIIGLVVAGMDGYHIAKNGNLGGGVFHAGPGAAIAALAGAVEKWASPPRLHDNMICRLNQIQDIGSMGILSERISNVRNDVPLPRLEKDQFLVRTEAVAINPSDTNMRGPFMTSGAELGTDYSGTVVACGPDVADIDVGDRVCKAQDTMYAHDGF